MTALQPSDKARFKDASEAEQALREAWDRCLTQGLVHPAILAMEELPHDKVGARMHEQRNAPARPPVTIPLLPADLLANDSSELTAVDDNMMAKPLTIESKKAVRDVDDDPTMLQVRVDELRGKPDATARGIGPERASGERPSGKARALVPDAKPAGKVGGSGGHARLGDAAATENDEAKVDTTMIGKSDPRRSSQIQLILVVAIVVTLAVAIGLYIGGVIRI
jgi:hypothetical protein